jgi:hypothetical protein
MALELPLPLWRSCRAWSPAVPCCARRRGLAAKKGADRMSKAAGGRAPGGGKGAATTSMPLRHSAPAQIELMSSRTGSRGGRVADTLYSASAESSTPSPRSLQIKAATRVGPTRRARKSSSERVSAGGRRRRGRAWVGGGGGGGRRRLVGEACGSDAARRENR